MNAEPVESQITYRQQQWRDAHERIEQQVGDLFAWYSSMRHQGRIARFCDYTLSTQLRMFNATVVAPLPMTE